MMTRPRAVHRMTSRLTRSDVEVMRRLEELTGQSWMAIIRLAIRMLLRCIEAAPSVLKELKKEGE